MIRLLFRLIGIIALATGAVVGSVYGWAGESSSAVRAFFDSPSGCAAPCFLGIQPGITPFDDARALLVAHPWIGDVRANPNNDVLTWRWNGSQPAFVSRYAASQFVGRIDFQAGVVTDIYVVTGALWGDWLGTFGVPDWHVTITRIAATHVLFVQTATYESQDMSVEATMRCPLRGAAAVWYAYTTVHYPAQSRGTYADTSADWDC